jgi:superfamily II DNA or RNA helicase/HKD family nuclease
LLNDKEFLEEYRTGTNNFVDEFYKKAFKESIEYWRAVGYFRSSSLEAFGSTLQNFLQDGGTIKLITSVELTDDDSNAIEEGLSKLEVCQKRIETIIKTEFNENIGTGVSKLAKLLEIGRLEIKIAVPNGGRGIYHEKVGLFFDQEENYIAFSGSANESTNAFENNYECIEVYTSWGDTSRARKKKIHFETLWNETNNDCFIFDFPEALKLEIIRKVNDAHPNTTFNDFLDNEANKKKNLPTLPPWLKLRDYQKEAINKWIKNDGHGLWAMATGSGKTITSLAGATHLLNSFPNGYVPLVVVVPYMHLVEQWASEGRNFNIDFIKCNSDYAHWENEINHALTNFIHDKKVLIPILTTTGTYKTPRFQKQIAKLDNILLIVDEAHNFGSKDIRKHYLTNTRFRLGLSATPKRHMDDEGSQAILDYFGDVIYTYALKDAIRDGNLTPYYYYPIFANLTADEEQEYYDLSMKISKQVAMGFDIDDPESSLKILLMKRAKIIATASNKIEKLKELLIEEDLINSKHNLFYTAAKIERDDDGYELRMVNKIVNLLRDMGMQVDKFTADENKDQRKYLIDKLSNNYIDGLVAIRCLDEGVDIPSVERAFILSSSSNPKEFIQRRGRVLRQSKETGKKFADIYDFIVIPNPDNVDVDQATLKMERNYLEKEFIRFQEFVEIAENVHEIEPMIADLKEKYKLLHI